MKSARDRLIGMPIRTYLGRLLAVTVTCGICLAGYFTWSFTTIERLQYQVTDNSLALRELHHLGEQLDLILVSADLAIGAGETYAAQIAMSLVRHQRQQLREITIANSTLYEQKFVAAMQTSLMTLELQIGAQIDVVGISHNDNRGSLLAEYDIASAKLVSSYEYLLSAANKHGRQASQALADRRSHAVRDHLLALSVYFLINAAIVFAALRWIALPLETLTRSATRTMSEDIVFEPSISGPREIERMASIFTALISRLEYRVQERTGALEEKTSRLQAEITTRESIQANLLTAKESAERSSKVKTEFLSVMSHELRTPMNAVLGALSLIHNSGVSMEQEAFITIAQESGRALMALLEDMLDVSRIESGHMILRNEDFSLAAVAHTTLEMLHDSALNKGLRISLLIDPAIPNRLNGDFHKLRRILLNLVGNAIKFTDSGWVDIAITLESSGQEHFTLLFEVIDTGTGVDSKAQTAIFDRFFQYDSSLSRQHSGAGLGLSICRDLARLMGGDCGIKCTGRQNGSKFWFTVNLQAALQGQVTLPKPSKQAITSQVILVEHDDSHVAAWLKKLLVIHAIPFHAVANLAAAREHLISETNQPNRIGCTLVVGRDVSATGTPGCNLSLKRYAEQASAVNNRCILLGDIETTTEYSDVENVDVALFNYKSQPALIGRIIESPITVAPAPPPSERAPVAPEPPLRSARCSRILLVEDNELNQLVASAILSNAGHHVEAVSSGQEAIDKILETEHDLVLMDLQMPGMDGLEAARRIRKLPGDKANIPIIAFSAFVMAETRTRCTAAGMDDFVDKPFDIDDLLTKIERWSSHKTSQKTPGPAARTNAVLS